MNKNLSNPRLLSYSLLAFCLAFIGLPIYIYLPNYYHSNFDFDLKLIALILLVTRLFDTIQDPIFGYLSDKYSGLKSKIICYTCPVLGLSFLFLFNPQGESLTAWLVIFLILTYSTYSIIYINYQSYAVSLSSNYNLKTKIISFREVAFILGIIFAAGAPSILSNFFGETKSFEIIGFIFLFLIIIFALIFYFFAPKPASKENQVKFDLLFLIKNPRIKKYFTIFFFNAISASIPAALILFFIEEVLNLKSLSGLFLILYFSGLMIGTIIWTSVSKRTNSKTKPWIIAMIIAASSFVWCYFLGAGDVTYYAIICLVSGIGFGADFSLGYSILTDIIQKEKLQNSETTIFGIANFIVKISLAISSAALIYLIGHFDEISQVQKKEFISFSYAILPVLFRIVSIILLQRNFKNA